MTGTIYTTTVEGKAYRYWSDFIRRGSFAEDEEGNRKQIKWSGYLTKDLTARKAIACAFGHKSFRK